MLAQDFILKWSPGAPAHGLNERAGAQAHFIDLGRVLGVPQPGDPERCCFERGLRLGRLHARLARRRSAAPVLALHLARAAQRPPASASR